MTPDELVAHIREKGGIGLARPLLDMGLIAETTKVTGAAAYPAWSLPCCRHREQCSLPGASAARCSRLCCTRRRCRRQP